MPLPSFKPVQDHGAPTGEATHYFDTAHGDVAALHARIESGLVEHHFDAAPQSPVHDRIEDSIRLLSRTAGVAGLLGALGMIAYLLI